ncbi:uncharacterized protein Tco025E_00479 [Trypanosoma conorhini]|uniref:SRR1-like domain-containing protein n=1 Tax=Trypanosoma conorhini TaxID=83891 RepID=A0A422QBE9_9TRYP|nr:uncharacterized protein Tco025E_00479 [Trypanosoma conorhini]RNF27288.1 hypothetical protein Tco025E_00479 [Trypanosoma conorhini]
MWSVVDAKQRSSRRRRETSAAKQKLADAVFAQAPPVSPQTISAVVRDLRRTSEALRGVMFVRRDVLAPLRQFLESHCEGCARVHLIALGIGPFSRQESRSGFLQMALFLALKKECEGALRRRSTPPGPAAAVRARVDASPGTKATGFSCEGSSALCTSFFDPAAGEFHACCCEKLGVRVETENRCGAYAPADPHALLIAYLPHSPWALLRNLLASNLLPCRDSAAVGQVGQLRSTLVIGNDLRGRAPPTDDFMEKLVPYLRFGRLRAELERGKLRCVDEAEELDGATPGGPRGLSRNDVGCAFSDTAVMQLNTELEAELLEALPRLRIPPLVCGGPEVVS